MIAKTTFGIAKKTSIKRSLFDVHFRMDKILSIPCKRCWTEYSTMERASGRCVYSYMREFHMQETCVMLVAVSISYAPSLVVGGCVTAVHATI